MITTYILENIFMTIVFMVGGVAFAASTKHYLFMRRLIEKQISDDAEHKKHMDEFDKNRV